MRPGIIGASAGTAIQLEISIDTDRYNIFTAAGSPADPVDVVLTINTGTNLYSSLYTDAALDTGTGWDPASTITIINKGNIWGMGGRGDGGATVYHATGCSIGVAGHVGGDSIELQHPVTINNTSGWLMPGGGGGGGGGSQHWASGTFSAGGGAGGGGAGFVSYGQAGGIAFGCSTVYSAQFIYSQSGTNTRGGAGGNSHATLGISGGTAGTSGSPTGGAGGAGGRVGGGGGGGYFGSAGGAGGTPTDGLFVNCSTSGIAGKAGGYYLTKNGHAVTWDGTGNRLGAER